MEKLKHYVIGFLTALLAVLAFIFGRKGGSSDPHPEKAEKAKSDAQALDDKFDQAEAEKKKPVEVKELDKFWKDRVE
jgi:hypothetical protein